MGDYILTHTGQEVNDFISMRESANILNVNSNLTNVKGIFAHPDNTTLNFYTADGFASGIMAKSLYLGEGYANYNNSYRLHCEGTAKFSGQILTSFSNSVANGSYFPAAQNMADLLNEVRYSSGCMGSVYLTTAYGSIPAAWYNYIYIPHRTGGLNGTATGDNCNYGSLLLFGMTVGGHQWHIRYANGAIAETKKFS